MLNWTCSHLCLWKISIFWTTGCNFENRHLGDSASRLLGSVTVKLDNLILKSGEGGGNKLIVELITETMCQLCFRPTSLVTSAILVSACFMFFLQESCFAIFDQNLVPWRNWEQNFPLSQLLHILTDRCFLTRRRPEKRLNKVCL